VIAGVCKLSVIDARAPGSARRIASVDDHTGPNVTGLLFCSPDYLVTTEELGPVLAAAADPRLPRAAAPLARLLGDVLRQQFGDDVRVGPAVLAAGDDEISL
jgi:hypothetical protein